MATQIPISDLAGLLTRIPDGPVGAPGLGPELARGETELAFPIDVGPGGAIRLAARPASGISLFAFNSPDDADPDGVLRPAGGVGSDRPPLTPAPDRAWIKTRFELSGAQVGGGEAGLGMAAGERLLLADYHVFGREESARSAVASALAGARFALRVDDVLELRPGEALSLQLGGALSANFSVRWADLFGGQISLLRRFVGEGEVIPLKLSAGSRLSATVRLRDEFLLVFSREEGGDRYRVSLRKARARDAGAGAGLGVEVEFEDPGQVERAVSDVAGAILGAPEARVRDALGRAASGSLAPGDAALVDALRRRFGVPEPAALLARVDEVKRDLGEAVGRIARTRLEVGFRYEYQRIERDASVLGVAMDASALREFHPQLVRARLEPVLDAVRSGDPRVSLEWFLGQRELEVSRSWGFSLGFGKWSAAGSDREEVRSVEERDAAGHRRVSYVGQRGYRGSWGGSEFEWAGDFGAAMDAFSAGPVPLMPEFGCGVHLLWRSSVPALREGSLREQLDTALVWEVFPQYALGEVAGRLRDFLGRPVELVTQLRIDDGDLRALLAAPAVSDPLGLAGPLGAAIPWLAGEPGREDVVTRRSLYGPLWAEYLRNPRPKPQAFARAAEDYLRRRVGQPSLANRERGYSASRAFTFAGLIELNPGTREAWERYRRGLELLRDSIARRSPEERVVAEVFRSLSGLWRQSLHVRASGAHFLDLARAVGALEAVERTLTVSSPDEVLVIGA